ncbi:MAG: hypothetical protein ACKOE6_09545 [Flammeovirgaceae bacterium]
MKLAVERYRGIEYVRISALPAEERKVFWQTFDQQKVIKILTADALLNDCVLVHDFLSWKEMIDDQAASILPHPLPVPTSHAA